MLEDQRVYCTTGVSGYQPLAKNCFAVAAQILAGLSLGRDVGSHEYGLMTATNTPTNIYQHPPPNQSINKSIKSSPNQNTIKITIKLTSKHKNKWNRPNQSIKSVNQYINKSVHPKKNKSINYIMFIIIFIVVILIVILILLIIIVLLIVVVFIIIIIIIDIDRVIALSWWSSPSSSSSSSSSAQAKKTQQHNAFGISFPVDWAAHFAAKGGPVLGNTGLIK